MNAAPTRLDKLLRDVRACRLCRDLPSGPRPIVQCDPAARILIAGQAPGRRVHESGIPFDDASGVRLRDWLGVSNEQFYDPKLIALLPMGFCYPGSGKGGDLPPRSECAPAWRAQLMTFLPNLALTVVIGAYAKKWHVPDAAALNLTQSVQQWRSWWPKAIVLPHPSPRNQLFLKRNPHIEKEMLPQLQKTVRRILSANSQS